MKPSKVPSPSIMILLAVVSMILWSCTSAQPQQPSPTPISTHASLAASPTPTPTPPAPANTLVPTGTASPTTTATATITVTPTEEACTNVADFIADVTIADDTQLLPGSMFTKTWRLRNTGTCTWTTEYAVVFDDGDQMGGPNEKPLPVAIQPGSTVDVSVDLTAPSSSGTYRGNWQLRNEDGKTFGTGDQGQWPFYLQIIVTAAAEEITPGAPDWVDTFANAVNWVLVDTTETRFSLQGGSLALESFNPGPIEEWGFVIGNQLTNFYLEMTVTTQSSCSGQDRYGFIFRAPDTTRGYVYTFACNGSYRLYRWDSGTFVSLKPWSSSALISSGQGQTNRLGVQAEGDKLKLFANRKLLATITDSTYGVGSFGLVVGSGATSNFTVLVDEVAYWLNP